MGYGSSHDSITVHPNKRHLASHMAVSIHSLELTQILTVHQQVSAGYGAYGMEMAPKSL